MNIVAKNEPNYRCIVPIIIIYFSITVAAGAMVNKLVLIGPGYVQGGAIITPLWYALADIIAEVYGYRISRQILWCTLIGQLIFAVSCFSITHLPSPAFWQGQSSYHFVFGNAIRIYLSGVLAFLISGFLNIYLISKWKIMVLGKLFWIRNIGSSTIAELLYTILIIPMISFGSLPPSKIFIIIATSYGLKLIYALGMSGPATLVVNYLKAKEGVDIYDYDVDFNPFKFSLTPPSNAQNTQPETLKLINP